MPSKASWGRAPWASSKPVPFLILPRHRAHLAAEAHLVVLGGGLVEVARQDRLDRHGAVERGVMAVVTFLSLRGRPRGRNVLPSPNIAAISACHSFLPNGLWRFTHSRTVISCSSPIGSSACSNHEIRGLVI